MAAGAWWMFFVWLALFVFLWWAWTSSAKIQRNYLKWIVRIIIILIIIAIAPIFFLSCLGIGPYGCM
jgi:hypothetical protein